MLYALFIIGLMKRRLLLGLVIILTSCMPQLEDSGPSVALINAPAEGRISGLADLLETHLVKSGPASYTFTPSSRVRFGETHRDMSGSRAPLQAAFIARTYGAAWAVMIGAPTYQREVIEFSFFNIPKRKIISQVKLEVKIVDPVTSNIMSTYASNLYTSVRIETIEGDLIEKDHDPDIHRLITQALSDIVPVLRQDLETRLANMH